MRRLEVHTKHLHISRRQRSLHGFETWRMTRDSGFRWRCIHFWWGHPRKHCWWAASVYIYI